MGKAKLVKFRQVFVGLSTDNKPTPATHKDVHDGVVFYEADSQKKYVYCQGQWYEKE